MASPIDLEAGTDIQPRAELCGLAMEGKKALDKVDTSSILRNLNLVNLRGTHLLQNRHLAITTSGAVWHWLAHIINGDVGKIPR